MKDTEFFLWADFDGLHIEPWDSTQELNISETTSTILPTTQAHYCKKGLHNLDLPKAVRSNGGCRGCHDIWDQNNRTRRNLRRAYLRFVKRAERFNNEIEALLEELDRILANAKENRN